MAQGFGHQNFALVGAETTWSTTAASFPMTLELIEDSLAAIREKIFSGSFRSRTKRHSRRGKEGAAGAIGVEFAFTNMGGLLKHAFGAIASSGPTDTTAFTHVFTLADAVQTGLTVQINRDVVETTNKGFQYAGCRVNSFTLALEPDGFLILTLDLIGKDETVDIAMTAGTFPDDFIDYEQVSSLKVNAVDIKAKVTAFELTVGNALDGDRRSLGDRNILEPVPGDHREITGSIGLWFESQVEYKDFRDSTDRAIELFIEGALVTGAAATNRSLKVELPRNILTGETPTVDTAGALSQTLTFESMFDKTGAQDAVKATLINETASAAAILL